VTSKAASSFKPARAARGQSGFTLVGLVFWAVVISMVALVVMKVFPAITEYRTVLSMVSKAAREGGSTVPEIRASFDRSSQIEYGVTSVTSKDLEVTKEDDKVVVSFAYDKEIELIDPVYLVIKFKGRSK
jgi:type II secretory pathway pseudopilin PulG